MTQEVIPWWWRPFWGITAVVTAVPMVMADHYGVLVPALAGYATACYGFERIALRSPDKPRG